MQTPPRKHLGLGARFLKTISVDDCERFVTAFREQSGLPLTEDVSENCSQYVKYYEDWWLKENPPFPNEW